MRRAAHVGDLLLACLRERPATEGDTLRELLSRVDVSEIPDAARYHRVVVPVHEALCRVGGVDVPTLGMLAALRREGTLAHFRAVATLRQVADVLTDLHRPWLVLKGPVLSEIVYARRRVRQYHDLDVLVRPCDFEHALDRLERAGFHLVDPNWKFHRRWVVAELRLAVNGGADVDLHWHLLFSREIRRSFRVPIADIVDRRREVVVENTRVLTLDAADTLIHLAMHACREGGDRLFWLKDIEQSIINEKPNWDDVVTRAHDWRVNILVGTMLARTRRTLLAPVPDEVIRALLPNTWRVATTTADRMFPTQRSVARGTIATLLAHGARESLQDSSFAIASNVLRMLRHLTVREPWGREKWDRGRMTFDSPHDPESKLYPAGNASDRTWWLNELQRESPM